MHSIAPLVPKLCVFRLSVRTRPFYSTHLSEDPACAVVMELFDAMRAGDSTRVRLRLGNPKFLKRLQHHIRFVLRKLIHRKMTSRHTNSGRAE